MKQKTARPKNGRPLQNPPPRRQDDFVAAVQSRAFRDGTGIFMVKLSHELPPPHTDRKDDPDYTV
jgi:hypothetical protein